jgi:hypothetical protein
MAGESPAMKNLREHYNSYDMDLLALWITHAVDSSDPDVIKLLATLDTERYQLYKQMRDRTHTLKLCANPAY